VKRVVAIAAGLMVSLAGCGGSALSSGMRLDVSGQLQADVLTLTQAAAAKNWTGARTALAALKNDLAASQTSGGISAARAAQIQATIATIQQELPAVPVNTTVPTPTPTPTTKAAPAPAPKPAPPPKKHHDHGDG
jgi:outer membrane biosynthesis protein TonB